MPNINKKYNSTITFQLTSSSAQSQNYSVTVWNFLVFCINCVMKHDLSFTKVTNDKQYFDD